jgi:cytochrome c oxidase cbb3-type subunit 2
MKPHRNLTLGLIAAFGAPWLILVVGPHAAMRNLEPVPYGEADFEATFVPENSYFPPGRAGLVAQGHRVYAQEGCAYCHTQVIRPTYAGPDRWRDGWTGRGPDWSGDEPPVEIRETVPRDYLGEDYAFLGVQRIGPDLANAGWRLSDEEAVHRHLYNPRSVRSWSVMPSYAHLYELRRRDGQGSDKALKLEGEFAPPEGYEVVPGAKAKALVSYLRSLRKDHILPGAGDETAPGTPAAPAVPAVPAGAPATPSAPAGTPP